MTGARHRRAGTAAAALAALLLAGCAQTPPSPEAPALVDLMARPAERALVSGLRAYDDGQYAEAERWLTAALKAGLAAPRDQAAAHKHLAFVYCTSDRVRLCEAAFLAARQADPSFTLGRSEAGHPLWGPVFRRVLP